jgi:hypothetical protein
MDKFIGDLMLEYHLLFHNIVYICALIAAWVALTGCIRFGIAAYRRKKGIYPPAASQMEEH